MTYSIIAHKEDGVLSTPAPGIITSEVSTFDLEGSAEEIITKLMVMAAGLGAVSIAERGVPPIFNKENKYLVIPNPFYGLD